MKRTCILLLMLTIPAFSFAQNKSDNADNKHYNLSDKELASGVYYKHLQTLKDVIVPPDCIKKRLKTAECVQARETFQKISKALYELPQDKWQMAVNGYVNKFRRDKEEAEGKKE